MPKILITALLVPSAVHHAFKTFKRFSVESPGIFFTLDKSKEQALILLVKLFLVLHQVLIPELCLGRVQLSPALLSCRIEKEDHGERRRQDRVVIQIFPPNTCSAITNM